MRTVCALLAGVLTFGSGAVSADQSRPFVVHLPDSIPAESCDVQKHLVGPFGGFGEPTAKSPAGSHSISISTNNSEGRPARSLKAAIACKDYETTLLNVPSLETSGYETSIAPAPNKWLPVAGRLLPTADGRILAGHELRVFFEAGWMCSFFELIDCLVPAYPVASLIIGPDGSFAFTVPNVLADRPLKVYNATSDSFKIDIEEQVPPFRRYWPESPGWSLRVAVAYPQPLLLRPVAAR
jgi:hypothetical protein